MFCEYFVYDEKLSFEKPVLKPERSDIKFEIHFLLPNPPNSSQTWSYILVLIYVLWNRGRGQDKRIVSRKHGEVNQEQTRSRVAKVITQLEIVSN